MTTFRDGARISGGSRDISVALEGMRLAREAKALPGRRPLDELAQDFAYHCTTRDLLHLWADAAGLPEIRTMGLMQGIGVAIQASEDARRGRRDMGTDTFTNILSNHAEKAMLKGWENVEHSWRRVARVSDLPDFRLATRTGLSEMLLQKTSESGEIKNQDRVDRAEYITASAYAGVFNISREALVNDDLGALVRLPFEAGISASATVNQAFWTYVTQASGLGPTLNQDSVALFNAASHGNYTASGAAPSVSTVTVGRTALRKQTDPGSGRRLNTPAKYLVVPPELEEAARVLAAADFLQGRNENLEVVVEAQLSDGTNGTTSWYLFGDENLTDTWDIGFVGGVNPHISAKPGWDVDGVMNKVTVDFGIAALCYRSVYRNKGV